MNKRGISPLLATVLIVGMTVAIAALVFLFLKGQVDLTAKKGELEFTANEEAQVQFQVTECSLKGSDLTLSIANVGNHRIDCFWVAPSGGATKLTVFNMKEGEEDSFTLKNSAPDTTGEVEVFPCLIEKDKIKTGSISVTAQCA